MCTESTMVFTVQKQPNIRAIENKIDRNWLGIHGTDLGSKEEWTLLLST